MMGIGTTTFKKDMIRQHTENKWSQYVVHVRPFGCLKNLQNIYFSGEYQVFRHLFSHTLF